MGIVFLLEDASPLLRVVHDEDTSFESAGVREHLAIPGLVLMYQHHTVKLVAESVDP